MSQRAVIARQAAQGLRRFVSQLRQRPVMIGFDGFVDSIIAVVDKRYDTHRYDPVQTIEQFSRKIAAAAGKSSNYELVVKLEKLGGNGPIMANALAAAGLPVTYVGAVGYPDPHPVFADLAQRAECLPIADPARTDALEFTDGKLMFGKLQSLFAVNWQRLDQVVGAQRFKGLVARSHLIGMVNWTMLPRLGEIWRELTEKILPTLHPLAGAPDSRRQVFVDLADPEKRTAEDLREALGQLSAMTRHVHVTLGLNLKESTQVAAALDLPHPADPEQHIEPLAEAICRTMGLFSVVIHTRSAAAAARTQGDSIATATFAGPYVQQPKISTGAGDHFNAGFVLGQLAGLDLAQTLCLGTAVSGYYVRNAASPNAQQLADFCEHLPEPQG
jgi:sugar/nucleoside kinase (ribokinase family)